MEPHMKRIDESRLQTDLGYRFEYLAEFMGFGAEDITAIHGAAPAIAPLVPTEHRHAAPKRHRHPSMPAPARVNVRARSHSVRRDGRSGPPRAA